MRSSAQFLDDLQPVIDRIAGGPMHAVAKPQLFPLTAQMQEVARQAERVARNRYDDGFLKGEVVGFTRGLQQGRKDADGFMAPVLIVGICIGAVVGAGAAMAGWFA